MAQRAVGCIAYTDRYAHMFRCIWYTNSTKKAYANINRSPCGSKENLSVEIASSLPQDLRTVRSLLTPLLACLLFIIGMRLVELSRLRGSCSGVLGQLQSASSLCMLQSLNLQ